MLPGMQAAFVDIGTDRNAFLYLGEPELDKRDFVFGGEEKPRASRRPKKPVKSGQGKSWCRSSRSRTRPRGAHHHITLPGRYVVLAPSVDYVGVSRRIRDDAERQRLKGRGRARSAGGHGANCPHRRRRHECGGFCRRYRNPHRKVERDRKTLSGAESALLHPQKDESLISRTVRDLFTPDVDRLVLEKGEKRGKSARNAAQHLAGTGNPRRAI